MLLPLSIQKAAKDWGQGIACQWASVFTNTFYNIHFLQKKWNEFPFRILQRHRGYL